MHVVTACLYGVMIWLAVLVNVAAANGRVSLLLLLTPIIISGCAMVLMLADYMLYITLNNYKPVKQRNHKIK